MLTGREARTLPPTVVRGLFWRIFAARTWDPELVRFANTELDIKVPMRVRQAKGKAVKALEAIEAALFPEDDRGD